MSGNVTADELAQFLMPNTFLTSADNNGNPPYVEIGYASLGLIFACSALVMLMTPALGLSGSVER